MPNFALTGRMAGFFVEDFAFELFDSEILVLSLRPAVRFISNSASSLSESGREGRLVDEGLGLFCGGAWNVAVERVEGLELDDFVG